MSRLLAQPSPSSPSNSPTQYSFARTPALRRRFTLYLVCCSLVVLFAFVLRIYQLGGQSVWFDEGWSWHLAGLPLGEMAAITAGDRSPALYYLLLHSWLELAGPSEFAMRALSVCADGVTVVLVMGLARRLEGGRREWERGGGGREGTRFSFFPAASVCAGLVYAVCPFVIFYAQETRTYALVAMLCTASSYALVRYLQARSGVRWLVASAVCLALAVHAHYYAAFLLPAHAALVLLSVTRRRPGFDKTRVIAWLVAAAGVVLAVVPWLIYASGGFAYDDGFAFPLNTIDGRMLDWLRAFAAGGFGAAVPDWGVGALAVAGGFAVAGWVVGGRWRALVWLVALVGVPLLAAAVAVWVVYPTRSVFHPRYLIYVAPVACVLLGSWVNGGLNGGVGEARSKLRPGLLFGPVVGVLLMLIWLPALHSYFTQPNRVRDDYRTATRHVLEALEPGEVVVMTRDNYAIRYYWQRLLDEGGREGGREGGVRPGAAAPLGSAALQGLSRADLDALLVAAPPGLHGVMHSEDALLAELNLRRPRRVRMMLWQDNVVDAEKRAETLFWANGHQIGEYNLGQIRLPLFEINASGGNGGSGPALLKALAFAPVNATFGGTLVLQQAWMRQRGTAGDLFYVVLEWQALQVLPLNYKVFIHVLDDEGQPKFQKDKLAIDELRPTSHWRPGERIRDPYSMLIPVDVAAGQYHVLVGVYDPATGERLVARTAAGARATDDSVELGTVTVRTP